tara:strand:+ start:1461 stop:1988 length:528 start_codon:yes stop_codon:yes gene_type:complete
MILRIIVLVFPLIIFAQQGYKPVKNPNVKGWDSSDEFKKNDVIAVNFSELTAKYLNQNITPKFVSKEFRDVHYKNFYRDKKLKKKIKNKKEKGFRNNSSNGAGGTLVYYRANSNYQLLYGKTFLVKNIYKNPYLKHVLSTDDTNFIFELYNDNLGTVYYEYNSKFKDLIEIEIID